MANDCENSNYSTVEYTGAPPSTNVQGCIPVSVAPPSEPPASDQPPFIYDQSSGRVFIWLCTTNEWVPSADSFADINIVDINQVADTCANLNVVVTYTIAGVDVSGTTTLGELSSEIANCLNISDLETELTQVQQDIQALQGQSANDIVSITSGADGRVIYTRRDGTQTTIQIDTDQVVTITNDSANNRIIFRNEDGSEVYLTAGVIKGLIASEYVNNTELQNAVATVDLDQVVNFSFGGANMGNLTITNEDGSSVSIPRNDMVSWLNNGLATDAEIAALASSFNSDQATLSADANSITLTNEDGSSSSISLSDIQTILVGSPLNNTNPRAVLANDGSLLGYLIQP